MLGVDVMTSLFFLLCGLETLFLQFFGVHGALLEGNGVNMPNAVIVAMALLSTTALVGACRKAWLEITPDEAKARFWVLKFI